MVKARCSRRFVPVWLGCPVYLPNGEFLLGTAMTFQVNIGCTCPPDMSPRSPFVLHDDANDVGGAMRRYRDPMRIIGKPR